jgi:hypothetical protein
MMKKQIQLNTFPTGKNESKNDLVSLDNQLSPKTEKPSVNPLPSLKSQKKPHELLEKLQLLKPRVLRVHKEDFDALCEVIRAFTHDCV